MELNSGEIAFAGGACECCACIIGLANDMFGFGRGWVVAVDEVEFAAVLDAVENRVRVDYFYSVPAHLWDFIERIGWLKSFDLTRYQPDTWRAVVFLAEIENKLHPDTYTKKRCAFGDDSLYGVENLQVSQVAHRGLCSAYAGEDDSLGR